MSEPRPFSAPSGSKTELEEGLVLSPRFDSAGLVTTVVTDWTSGELLMVAYMNAEAFDLTISTGIAHYYSRSRRELWKKGETSGALQSVREIRVDCDQDAVWLRVEVSKPEETCHTHRTTCFYRLVDTAGDGRSLKTDPSLMQHRIPAGA
ncbi:MULTISPECIES: phosphoribosyl-AMP cyclohydrolase [unclassified Aureimonas]|uniref:phosphoribosyl-AMP cyclohydrolase n=1 Tax=unclassified Aureimonas TaxID=2615206 RepID=UPI0006FC46B0|nr:MULTISPECIES: phosphoribosyl-AMP cyclohydrolase [unclassified Aureimonas]KQT57523.1 phosphoribosyl-AMP cyclohydrolase [Aureimonas sp. Leaf427]KQT77204.1 phosphoribosyl-AMP cyclohydrolase [Aureimonas sp. Leaf460]